MYSRLGKKVTIAMLIVTVILALISTAIQVNTELKRDIGVIEARVNRVDQKFVTTIADAVWQVDRNQVLFQLEVLKAQLNLSYVRMTSPDLEEISLGTPTAVSDPKKTFQLELTDSDGSLLHLGELTLSSSLAPVYSQLKSRLLLILTVNGIKSIILTFFLLLVANVFVTRRLLEFAAVIGLPPEDGEIKVTPLLLKKTTFLNSDDEIDDLVATYSEMSSQLGQQRRKLDVSNRELAEKVRELTDAKQELEKALTVKSAFVSMTSHELRTPLTAISGFLEVLGQNLNDEKNARKYLEIIERNSSHLLSLVNDILTLSGIDESALKLVLAPVDLAELLRESVDNVRNLADKKSVSLGLEVDLDARVTILTDASRIRQVLNNLIGNAIKFTDTGGVLIKCKQVNQSEYSISVIDSGEGISARDQLKIFDAFTQADDSSTRRHGGSGLGLTISRNIARILGGNVVLKNSSPDSGSVFEFTFTAEPYQLAGVLPQSKMAAPLSEFEKKRIFLGNKIVVIDDNSDNLALMSAILTDTGAEIVLEKDGKSGVATALRINADIVLMDIQMPGINGYEATQLLIQSGFSNPIIAVTAKADESEGKRCRAAGCIGMLSKPIDTRGMMDMLVNNLRKYS